MALKDLLKSSTIGNWVFVLNMAVSLVLILCSFAMPPSGVIDASVLGAAGIMFAFAALGAFIQAIANGKSASVKHGETELIINNDDEQGKNN